MSTLLKPHWYYSALNEPVKGLWFRCYQRGIEIVLFDVIQHQYERYDLNKSARICDALRNCLDLLEVGELGAEDRYDLSAAEIDLVEEVTARYAKGARWKKRWVEKTLYTQVCLPAYCFDGKAPRREAKLDALGVAQYEWREISRFLIPSDDPNVQDWLTPRIIRRKGSGDPGLLPEW